MIPLKWRLGLIGLVLFFAGLSVAPNFFKLPDFMSQKKLVLGLDIQGGLHLVMEADIEGVMQEEASRTAASLQEYFSAENVTGIQIESLQQGDRNIIQIQVTPSNKQRVRTLIDRWQGQEAQIYVVMEEGDTLLMWRNEIGLQDARENIVNQSVETLRNRINARGVAEPYIAAQGTNRVLIQIPGIKDEDYQKAKDLINKTAKLEFMLVAEGDGASQLDTWISEAEEKGPYNVKTLPYTDYIKRLNEDLKDKLEGNQKVLFEKAGNVESIEMGKIPYLLNLTDLGGNDLRSASVGRGERNEPTVDLEFNTGGARKFSDLTGANVNKQMAIVLDDIVYSAPTIQTKISGGRGQITLGAGRDYEAILDEASTLAMALRAGALPARLEQIEERTVGPTLGADSIAKGKTAIMIGGVLVLLFMLFYYKAFGLLADLALGLNMCLILAVLTAMEATLTLPGIAGIALTIGMAVDANVIIFERIKEALRKGADLGMAIREGYSKGLSAIFDANITTAATSIILMYFGTGPVRGFAVTLLIGITTSLFTAIFVTKTVLDFYTGKLGHNKLAI